MNIYEFNFDDGDDNSTGLMLVAAINKQTAIAFVNRRNDAEDWSFWKTQKSMKYAGRSTKKALLILQNCSRGSDHGFML